MERTHQSFINTHHRTSIIKFTTIIGGREYGDKLSVSKEFIPILDNLTSHHMQYKHLQFRVNLRNKKIRTEAALNTKVVPGEHDK